VRNPEYTKALIVEEASKLFNTLGYKATSLSDITAKTGLTKGAIYRHFENKAELEKEALWAMVNQMVNSLRRGIQEVDTAPDKLNEIFKYFKGYEGTPPFEGGCPLLNAATEADDTNPELLSVVKEISKVFLGSIVHIIVKGQQHGQFSKDVDAKKISKVMFASLEGAVMLNKMNPKGKYLKEVVSYLNDMVKEMST